MIHDPNTIPALYKNLLTLYPRRLQAQLGESIEQTFNDLYKRRQTEPGLVGFLFRMFLETGAGILREHVLLLAPGGAMKTFVTKPALAAIISIFLALPLGLTLVAFTFDIDPLIKPLNSLFTIEGRAGDINLIGRIVIYGGLLFLPLAFALNLQPMLRREGPEGKRTFYTLNFMVGTAILLLILFTWGGLMLEEIYCLQGIRCD